MADPDLQISGGDGEGGSPDIRTELVSRNFCFRSLGPHFGLKISGGRGRGGGDASPGSAILPLKRRSQKCCSLILCRFKNTLYNHLTGSAEKRENSKGCSKLK